MSLHLTTGLTPGGVILLCMVMAAAAGVIYFARLDRAAQVAAILAFPTRRALSRTSFGSSIFRKATGDCSIELSSGQVLLEEFDAASFAELPSRRGKTLIRGAKRLLDIVTSLSLLIFTLPLLVIVAAAIKLESPGPVFYKQTRVGRQGRLFKIYKFRSMRNDAERDGAQWAQEADPRITAVGRFIRKTRLDEIPQAFNILRGDMSFVGPRPERPEFVEMLAEEIPHFEQRLLVKPGLTGWAQINHHYTASVSDTAVKLSYDLYYIKHFSLVLDIFIMVKTVKVALFGIGSR